MGGKSLLWLLVAAGGFFLLSQCYRPTHEQAMRVTIEVDTPNGLRTGTSVIQLLQKDSIPFLRGSGIASGGAASNGDAPFVDLGGGRYLFAMLEDPAGNRSLRNLQDERRRDAHGRPAEGWFPMLITFRDISDPASVEEVDPANLEGPFGRGYSLRDLRVEMTDDPPTFGRIEAIAAFKRKMGLALHRDESSRVAPGNLTWNNFSRELNKFGGY